MVTVLIGVESNAEETNNFTQSSNSAERPWYAGIVTSYLIANGDVNFYGNTQSIYGGSPTVGMDDGRALSLIFGRDLSDGWSLEGQVSYQNIQSSLSPVLGFDDRSEDWFTVDAEIESTIFMLNGIYDFDIGASWFKPYLKGGIGVSRNKTDRANIAVEYNSAIWDGSVLQGQLVDDISYPTGKSTEFAWNVGAGLVFDLSEKIDLSFEYGFMNLGEALTETDGAGDALGFSDVSAQSISLGIDYRF
jgi:opacity protein-like surface antigen